MMLLIKIQEVSPERWDAVSGESARLDPELAAASTWPY